jgi:rubredoxin
MEGIFLKGIVSMEKWECQVWDYVYEKEKGGPGRGIQPKTKFEDLPDDRDCPECGVGKDQFKKL